jgi:hypothetical protein
LEEEKKNSAENPFFSVLVSELGEHNTKKSFKKRKTTIWPEHQANQQKNFSCNGGYNHPLQMRLLFFSLPKNFLGLGSSSSASHL